ncbi:MAG: nucleotidyltransferase substrate binding protein [Bacteroidales bacterium]|nr:nucleotidyltransferase substrate binding protein [Bacteroidales bacterium]MCF8386503.1 nucleotidyltransferase substrate binding protein [Bacteroidales bacterium]MCF8397093.1 nucleotidyltransferase substrate binding protein [Bacteroidales bacterium]
MKEVIRSRDIIREAFKLGLIEAGEIWMDMLRNRNRTSHTYNEENAREISIAITSGYFTQFAALKEKFEKLYTDQSPSQWHVGRPGRNHSCCG